VTTDARREDVDRRLADAAATPRSRVIVAICTFRRPVELARLLQRLEEVATDARSVADVGVVVVDDDPDGSAAAVVADRPSGAFPLGLRCLPSGRGNISLARNAAVAAALEQADAVAMIDDDCVPAVDWVRQLVEARSRTGAGCVTGACEDVAPAGAPAWLTEQPFLQPATPIAEGEQVDLGPLKNCLVDAAVLRELDTPFDPAFGLIGGEDVMFFRRLEAMGVEHRHAAAAWVREQLPATRATFGYQAYRHLWYGNTEAVTSVAAGTRPRVRVVVSGGKRLVTALLHPLRELASRRPPQVRWASCQVLRGIGRIVGACGIRLRHR
jgi:succinoglycan biosynthesis protein ExoM